MITFRVWNGEPCGSAVLNLQAFQKLAHTCLLTILVEESRRGIGVGTALLSDLIDLAKDTFHIEVLHLEVYEDNPALGLYEKMGFKPFGEHKNFTRETDRYRSKIFMQKLLKLTDTKGQAILIGTESIISIEESILTDVQGEKILYRKISSRGAMVSTFRVVETINEIYNQYKTN